MTLYEKIRFVFQLQSLALTIPVVIWAIFVVIEAFHPAFKRYSFKKLKNKVKDNEDNIKSIQMAWILSGICIGFFGNAIDNFYWFFFWSSSFLNLKNIQDIFLDNGVFINLIFRQLFTLCAAYCHLRAFICPKKEKIHQGLNILLWSSCIIGEVFIVLLLFMKT